jgi:hypothetical protein
MACGVDTFSVEIESLRSPTARGVLLNGGLLTVKIVVYPGPSHGNHPGSWRAGAHSPVACRYPVLLLQGDSHPRFTLEAPAPWKSCALPVI